MKPFILPFLFLCIASPLIILYPPRSSVDNTAKAIALAEEWKGIAEKWEVIAKDCGRARDEALLLALEAVRQRDEAQRQCGEKL
jgi:hypothetical protein